MDIDQFDPDTLRLPPEAVRRLLLRGSNRPQSQRELLKPDYWFVVIPFRWRAMAQLPGPCLVVAMVIKFLCDIHGCNTVTLTNRWLQLTGIGRTAKGRVLRELEKAGYIKVQWRQRASPIVTLLDIKPEGQS
jgi:hypothetical protein